MAPFFIATYRDASYDSTEMGAGEYAALFIWYSIATADKNTIILIEEPETYLSIGSLLNLLDVLIYYVDIKKLFVVMSTHSGKALQSVPRDSVRYVRREGNNCVVGGVPHPLTLDSIGVDVGRDIFVYVEDKAASVIARILMEKFDAGFGRRCAIGIAGGEAKISRALEVNKENPFSLRMVGWYDGDQDGKVPDQVLAHSALLPGNSSFEMMFRAMVSSEIAKFEAMLGVDNLGEILAALEGQDPHDWSFNFANSIGRSHESCLGLLLDAWLDDAAHLSVAHKSFADICLIADHEWVGAAKATSNSQVPQIGQDEVAAP